MEKQNCDHKEREKKKSSGGGKFGTAVGIILCIILIPILIVNVTMIVKSLIEPGKVPTFGGYSPLIVLTDSMYPSIESGDLIVVKAVDAADVKEGDVISFFDPDSTGSSVVTHRVQSIRPDGSFITKGDANNTEDQTPIPADQLVGRYQLRIPKAGNVAMFLQTTPGLIVCVGLPLLLLVGYELLRRRKYEKTSKQDTDALLAELEALRAQAAARSTPEETDAPSGNKQ